MSPTRSRRARTALVLVVAALCTPAPPVAAAVHSGTSTRSTPPGIRHPPGVEVPYGTYAPPVQRPVSDPFRMDAGPYGAGNRGLEYATVPGDAVHAVAAGVVAFAGPVAGRRVVSIEHPDGRRSTLTGMESIHAEVGDIVARGTRVGTAGASLHLGVIEAGRYVDPSALLAAPHRRAVLVPAVSAAGGWGSTVSPRSVARADVALRLQPATSPPSSRARRPESHLPPGNTLGRSLRRASLPGLVEPRGRSQTHECSRHHEATAGGRCPLRAPDAPLEPEDEAIHPR